MNTYQSIQSILFVVACSVSCSVARPTIKQMCTANSDTEIFNDYDRHSGDEYTIVYHKLSKTFDQYQCYFWEQLRESNWHEWGTYSAYSDSSRITDSKVAFRKFDISEYTWYQFEKDISIKENTEPSTHTVKQKGRTCFGKFPYPGRKNIEETKSGFRNLVFYQKEENDKSTGNVVIYMMTLEIYPRRFSWMRIIVGNDPFTEEVFGRYYEDGDKLSFDPMWMTKEDNVVKCETAPKDCPSSAVIEKYGLNLDTGEFLLILRQKPCWHAVSK